MKILATLLISILFSFANAQTASDYAVRVTATISENPPSITLHWNQYSGATEYSIYRKPEGSNSWGAPVESLPGDSLQYKDTGVQIDSLYEYSVKRTGNGITAYGYLTGAIRLHSKDYKGYLLLVVDTVSTDSLETELQQLMKDIANDGWGVERINVSRFDPVTQIKSLIQAEYDSNPDVKSVFLFGHVPVPYSGLLNPDGHPDHYGAWPADAFFWRNGCGLDRYLRK